MTASPPPPAVEAATQPLAQSVDELLEVSPNSHLHFVLERDDPNPSKCVLTLVHPGTIQEHIAYKVMTNQPRRYMVKPSQGVIGPDDQAHRLEVWIVDKYRKDLIQTYDRLGPTTIQNVHDKFMVQACVVSKEFSYAYQYYFYYNNGLGDDPESEHEQHEQQEEHDSVGSGAGGKTSPTREIKIRTAPTIPEEEGDEEQQQQHHAIPAVIVTKEDPKPIITKDDLVGLFKRVFGKENGLGVPVQTKKVLALHTVAQNKDDEDDGTRSRAALQESIRGMTKEQLVQEYIELSKKYDRLVEFTSGLTSERDALRRKLEQSKRR